MLWNVSPISEFSSVNHIGNFKDIQKNRATNLQIFLQTHLQMRLLELPKSISTQPKDESAKTYRDINVNEYSSQIVQVKISSQLSV